MNKFKADFADNKLLLDIERPNPLHFGDDQEFNPKYQEKLKAWNSRLSYSLSKELRDKLTDGEVIERAKDFVISCKHCMNGDVHQDHESIAIPLPEQTSKVKEPERFFTLEDDDLKCVPGCKHYTGGEIRHHKTCPFYPDSLSIKYDELDRKASQEWFTIQDVLLAFDAGNKRGAYPISIGHNPHPNKEDYVNQTFGIDIKNNQL